MSAPEYKTKDSAAAAKKEQLKYNPTGKADKQIPVLSMPSKIIADANTAAATARLVGKGNLCRVHGSVGYLAFGAVSLVEPDANTQTALLMDSSIFLVVATDDYIRTSAAVRVEVIED